MKICCIQMLLFILFTSLCCVTSKRESIRVFGYKGREATVSCSYDVGYESHEKYLCRDNCGNDDVLITTAEAKKDRFTIKDDINKRIFTTTISNLQCNDAGKYWCGVEKILHDYYPAEVSLEVVNDTCCDSSTKVQRYEGESVSITCPYESQQQKNLKYMCRGNHRSTCLQQAVVSSTNTQSTRFTLTEQLSTFTVNITSLTLQDSGSYLCGVNSNKGLDVFTAVALDVKENTCCDSSTKVQRYEGESVSITCPYESRQQNNLKYMCRGNHRSTCLQQAVVSSTNTQSTRFTLTEQLSTFTVNITSLTLQDSGSYLCGVNSNKGLGFFTAVDLDVKEWCCATQTVLRGTVGHPVTMQCPYPPQHEANRKFLCKGDHHRNCTDVTSQTDVRFTLLDNSSSSSFLVMVSELEAGDAGTYWCGSDSQWSFGNYTNIQLSVDAAAFNAVVFSVPAVLLFALLCVIVMVCKYKSHKRKGTGGTVETTKAGDAEDVISESDTYENQDVIVLSKQTKSKEQSSCSLYEEGEDVTYENFNATEDVYCNDIYVNKR